MGQSFRKYISPEPYPYSSLNMEQTLLSQAPSFSRCEEPEALELQEDVVEALVTLSHSALLFSTLLNLVLSVRRVLKDNGHLENCLWSIVGDTLARYSHETAESLAGERPSFEQLVSCAHLLENKIHVGIFLKIPFSYTYNPETDTEETVTVVYDMYRSHYLLGSFSRIVQLQPFVPTILNCLPQRQVLVYRLLLDCMSEKADFSFALLLLQHNILTLDTFDQHLSVCKQTKREMDCLSPGSASRTRHFAMDCTCGQHGLISLILYNTCDISQGTEAPEVSAVATFKQSVYTTGNLLDQLLEIYEVKLIEEFWSAENQALTKRPISPQRPFLRQLALFICAVKQVLVMHLLCKQNGAHVPGTSQPAFVSYVDEGQKSIFLRLPLPQNLRVVNADDGVGSHGKHTLVLLTCGDVQNDVGNVKVAQCRYYPDFSRQNMQYAQQRATGLTSFLTLCSDSLMEEMQMACIQPQIPSWSTYTQNVFCNDASNFYFFDTACARVKSTWNTLPDHIQAVNAEKSGSRHVIVHESFADIESFLMQMPPALSVDA